MLTYPASPNPSFSYQTNSAFKTLLSDFDSGAETRRKLIRFPKREYSIAYKNLIASERDLLHAFYRNVGGMADSFWFVDFITKTWVDEYVGRGLWYSMDSAIAFRADSATYVDETTAANNATANDMNLMPASNPMAGDIYYFGCEEMFDQLRINVGTKGDGTWTITWQYWNGSWANLTVTSDTTNNFQTSGNVDMKFDRPSDWVARIVSDSALLYFVRANRTAFTSQTAPPLGTQSWTAVRLYDLHSKTTTAGSYKVYVDGVLQTGGGTDYSFITAGGEASVDRIRFISAPASGVLITSDFEGYLRIKARLGDDAFNEEMPFLGIYNVGLKAIEVQW